MINSKTVSWKPLFFKRLNLIINQTVRKIYVVFQERVENYIIETHLDLDHRGHVNVWRVTERQLVRCRRFRPRRKHP